MLLAFLCVRMVATALILFTCLLDYPLRLLAEDHHSCRNVNDDEMMLNKVDVSRLQHRPLAEGHNMLRPLWHRMPDHSTIVSALKSEEYTPAYLSSGAFDPQAASFFYDSATSHGLPTASSTPAQSMEGKPVSTGSYEGGAFPQTTSASMTSQQNHSREYVLPAQRQHFYQHPTRQHYCPQTPCLAHQQQDYWSRREVQAATQLAAIQHGHPFYQQSNNIHGPKRPTSHQSNLPYSVLPPMANQHHVQRHAPTVGAVEVQRYPVMVRPRYIGEAQEPQYNCSAPHLNWKPNMTYDTEHMFTLYDGDVGIASYSCDQAQDQLQQIQSVRSPIPAEYLMEQSDNDFFNHQGITKVEPLDEHVDGNGLDFKRRRRSKKILTFDNNGDAADVEGARLRKKRPSKRKKLISESEGGDSSLLSTEAAGDASAGLPTHGELLKQKKKNMAFPKGTFLVRYADLDSDDYAGHIWLVDNHQLLQKYTYDGLDPSNVRIFSRTERYSGWLCTCPWLYHPLYDVKTTLGNMEKVSVKNHPTRDELLARREEERKKAPVLKQDDVDGFQGAGNSDVEASFDEHEAMIIAKNETEEGIIVVKTGL